ncbi:MAG: cytochrome d ubiquinol oxidase subunit II [Sedimentisphaerales bacterium]|nr:cytochrome d ubiquinol oxidase subunit II [Sedimentisphaerales bacterium]
MTLEVLWFFLWGLLWALYFITDGFDLGAGTLLPFLAKNETEKRLIYNATGPVWDGNQVWLITAGGVTFAAFPRTYAVMFSAFYTAFFLLLLMLILRGVSFGFRSKATSAAMVKLCDVFQFFGSGVTAILLGVAFANIFKGLPIENGVNKGGLLNLLSPYGILGGIFFLSIFLLHGAIWLSIKTDGVFHARTVKTAKFLWAITVVIAVIFLAVTKFQTTLYDNYINHPLLWVIPVAAVVALLAVGVLLKKGKCGYAWGASAAAIFCTTFFAIVGLYPNMLISTIDPAHTITLNNAASSPLTLKVMLAVVLLFLPFVIGYQLWAYSLFSKKIRSDELIY